MTRLIAIVLAASALSSAWGAPTETPPAAEQALSPATEANTPANSGDSDTSEVDDLAPPADFEDPADPDAEAAPNPTIPGMNRESREPARTSSNARPGAVRKPARTGLPASAAKPQGSIARNRPNSSSQSTSPVTARGVTAKPVTAPAFKRQSFSTKAVRAQPVTARGVSVKGVTARGIKASTVRAQGVKARPVTARGVTAAPVRARPVTVSK